MAGSVNAGSIVYEVDMDTAKLLAARREVDAALNGMGGSMGRLEASVNRTERSVGSMERSMSSLTGVAKGLMAALSVQQVASYADAWTTLNNKIANSRRPGEEQADVMQRIFDISQATQSSLNGTATLYARLERGTRLYNTSAEDLTRLTTIINQGFAVSGATAQEAENAIVQLSQGLAAGALRGEEFNSVSEQGSRLTIALADSLGVTLGQLRSMAAEGKLTTDVIVNGLLSQGDAIGKEFAATTVTISQGLLVAGNNITKFFGENSTVKSFAAGFRDSVITISENLDGLSSVLILVAGVMGSRYVGALTMATAAKVRDIAANRERLVSENQTAQAALIAANNTTRRSIADKEAAISAMNLAQAEYNVARGSSAEALALENLIVTKTAARNASLSLAQAEIAQAAAQTQAAAAARAASVSIGLARGALSLIGGPAGAAMLAGAAVFYFYQKAQQAKQESIHFADKLDGVISKMKEMNQTQLGAEIAKAEQSIIDQKDAIKDLRGELDALQQKRAFIEQAAQVRGASAVAEDYQQVQRDIAIQAGKVDSAENKLSQTVSKVGLMRAQLNGNLAQGIDLLKRDGDQAGVAAGLMNQFGNALDFASRQKEKFNSQSLKVERPKNVQDYLDDQQRQVELQSEMNERKRDQLKAEQDIRKLGGSEADVALARQRAGAEYDSLQAQKNLKKETRDGVSEAKKAATQAESNAQKLADLKQQSELTAEGTRQLSREQAILAAQQSLNAGASQEDIRLAGEYAAKKWDVTNALKAQAAAEKLLPEAQENANYKQDVQDLETALAAKKISQEQYNATSEQLEATHQANLAKIRANQAVTPQQEAAGAVDPVQALANENARKLALIQQFEQQKTITEQQGLALRNAANTEYEQQRVAAQWEIWRNQSAGNEALAASFDALSGNASNALTGIISGSMSAEDAMRSIGNTVLNSLINTFVQMGVEWAKSAIMGAATQQTAIAATTAAQTAAVATQTAVSTTAAAATAAAWTPAAILSSIASMGTAAAIGLGAVAGVIGMNLLGKRKNGGPVSAGGLYQVGESGLPEIYQASNGRQYMIPGDNGSVISNKDMQSGGGINVQLNVQNYSGATVDAQASSDGNGGVTIDMIVADLNNGGPVSQGIVSNFNVKRKARGQG